MTYVRIRSAIKSFPVLSRAGAAGRLALIEEGVKLLGVDHGICTARNGAVVCGNRSIAYGDIVTRGNLNRNYTSDELQQMPIKRPAERLLIGRDTNALDVPPRSTARPATVLMRPWTA
jgi:hypothetical protein